MIGVLALQGDFREHKQMIERIGVPVIEVRQPKHLAAVHKLIIPGGESTTIGKLLVLYQLLDPIRSRAGRDLALWGTCAGAILMARTILDGKPDQPTLGVMAITVRRNAFGRQLDSFEQGLHIPALGADPLPGIFIRAPRIEAIGQHVEVLACLADGSIIAAREGSLLVTTFHPELSDDDRFHRFFLEL